MSWQDYVDKNMLGTGNLSAGAILGLAAGSVWAQKNFSITPAEHTALIQFFGKGGQSVNVGGVKYLVVKGDERSLYGKKDKTGIVAVKTTQCILVGIYGETQVPGNANKTVESLADYLIENGY